MRNIKGLLKGVLSPVSMDAMMKKEQLLYHN